MTHALPLPMFGQMLAATREHELGCDDCFAHVDAYAERVRAGEDAGAVMREVEHHLALCGSCREEFEALLAALRATQRLTR